MDGSIAAKQAWGDATAASDDRAHVALPSSASLPAAALARLYFALEAARVEESALIVQFIGVAGGEGVSTVAAAYAQEATRAPGGKILLVRCTAGSEDSGSRRDASSGLLEAFRNGRPLRDVLAPAAGNPADAPLACAPGRGAVRSTVLGDNAERDAEPRALAALAVALRQDFSLVVLDCAPLCTSPLTGALSRIADGTVVVVAAGRTRRRGLERTVGEIAGLGGQVVGLVLNRHRDWLPGWLRRRTS